MYFDLYVPVPQPLLYLQQRKGQQAPGSSKKQKGKHQQQQKKNAGGVAESVGGDTGDTAGPSGAGMNVNSLFTPAQLIALEKRVDMLVHLGYSVLALTQTIHRKLDPKTHINTLDVLVPYLEKKISKTQVQAEPSKTPGQGDSTGCPVVFLKRLNIVLDDESEKGIGLAVQTCNAYDILSLTPTTASTLSLACLTHTLPSQLTAHIVTIPLSSTAGSRPAAISKLKHTLVRTTKRNGAVFEIGYVGALGGIGVEELVDAPLDVSEASSTGGSAAARADMKRSWWAAAKEVVRLTKGTGVIVSGAVGELSDLRAPRDVGNLITLLGLAQDQANDALTKVPQSLALRAQTRKTYRAVLSEPRLVIPQPSSNVETILAEDLAMKTDAAESSALQNPPAIHMDVDETDSAPAGDPQTSSNAKPKGQKRPRESDASEADRKSLGGDQEERNKIGSSDAAQAKGMAKQLAPSIAGGDPSTANGGDAQGKRKKRKKHRSVLGGS